MRDPSSDGFVEVIPFIVDEDCPPQSSADFDFPFRDFPGLWILMESQDLSNGYKLLNQ